MEQNLASICLSYRSSQKVLHVVGEDYVDQKTDWNRQTRERSYGGSKLLSRASWG